MTAITRVTTAIVEANFDYTFVRVHTDSGEYGTGECFMAPGIASVARELGKVLTGLDPCAVARCRARLMAAASGSGGAAGGGMIYNAVSGIDGALWDLCGKLLGQPVYQLLGGAFRDEVPVYADLHAGGKLESLDSVMRYREPFWMSDSGKTVFKEFYWEAAEGDVLSLDAMIERIRGAKTAGYRRFKFDLDLFRAVRESSDRSIDRATLSELTAMVIALREAAGDETDIAFDCHWRFDVPAAIAIARAVEPARPMWLEDPIPPDPVALAAVAANSPVPIATGENTYLVEGFLQLIQRGSAHVLTPDVQKAGGLMEAVRIADVAARHFLPIAPHCIASPVGFLGAMHVCAVASNVLCLEFHGSDVPFWGELVAAEEPIISGGVARVPSTPGIGAELDLDVVARYSTRGEPIFDE